MKRRCDSCKCPGSPFLAALALCVCVLASCTSLAKAAQKQPLAHLMLGQQQQRDGGSGSSSRASVPSMAFREPSGVKAILAINVTWSVADVMGQEHAFINSIQVTYDVGGPHPVVEGPYGNPAFPGARSRTLHLAPDEYVMGGRMSTDARTLYAPLGSVELLDLTTSAGKGMEWGFTSLDGEMVQLLPQPQQQHDARRQAVPLARALRVQSASGSSKGGKMVAGKASVAAQQPQPQHYALVGVRGRVIHGHFGAVNQLAFVWRPLNN